MFKVNSRNTTTKCHVYKINNNDFEQVSPLIVVFLLLTLDMYWFARYDEHNTA